MEISTKSEPILEMNYIRSRQECETYITIKKHHGKMTDEMQKKFKKIFFKGINCLGGYIYRDEERYGVFFVTEKTNKTAVVIDSLKLFGIDEKRITKDIKIQIGEVLQGLEIGIELPLYNDKEMMKYYRKTESWR